MSTDGRQGRRRALGAAVPALLVLSLAAHAAVLGVRATSVFSQWRDVITEGAEGPHVYALWRVLHGHPLYESPVSPPYSLTFYNALFYRAYAAVLGWAGVDGEGILLGGRLVTLGFAVVGAVAWAGLTRSLLPSPRTVRTRWQVAVLAALVWFGSQFASWWPLSIRPDVAAVACVAAGLWLAVLALRRESAPLMAVASLAFTGAWAFKQSVLAAGAGAGLYLLAARRWRLAAALALPIAGCLGAALLFGTPGWRFNTLLAPGMSRLDLHQGWDILRRTLPQNLLVFGLGGASLAWGVRGERGAGRAVWQMLACSAGVAAVAGLAGVLRAGGNRNHLFELYLVCSVAAAVAVVEEGSVPRRAAAALGLGLLLGFAAVQLALPNRFGTLTLDGAARRALRGWVRAEAEARGGTLLVLDDVLSQPWNASRGRYPAYVLDPVWLDVALRERAPAVVREVAAQPGVVGILGPAEAVRGFGGCVPLPGEVAPGWFSCR